MGHGHDVFGINAGQHLALDSICHKKEILDIFYLIKRSKQQDQYGIINQFKVDLIRTHRQMRWSHNWKISQISANVWLNFNSL